MTVNEFSQIADRAIRERIDRFNNLFKNAVGYTFVEEGEVLKKKYDEEYPVWRSKFEEFYKSLGCETEEQFWEDLKSGKIERTDEVNKIIRSEPQTPSPLYDYEKFVIIEARKIALWFVENFGDDAEEKWNELAQGKKMYQFADELEKQGLKLDPGHSGNSINMAVVFSRYLLWKPEMFKFLHGALAGLVGDAGYHDDRKDVEEYLEKNKDEGK